MITALLLMLQLATATPDSSGFTSGKGKESNPIVMNEYTTTIGIRAESKSPVSQKTVEKLEIQTFNFGQEMPFQLSKTPSILYQSDGGNFIGYSYFRIRGIDQTRINMTLNGMPMNEPEDQGAYFSNYGDFMSNIQSFQVQRGIGMSANGVASYGGSVNMMFNNLSDTTKEAEIGYGSFQSNRFSLSLNSGIINNIGAYARVSNITSGGYRYNSNYTGLSAFGSIGYFLPKDVLQGIFFFGSERSNMAWAPTSVYDIERDSKTNPLSPDEKDDFNQSVFQLQYMHEFSDIFSVGIQTFYNHLNGNYIVRVPDPLNFNLASDWYGMSVNGNLRNKPLTVYFGLYGSTYRRDHFLNAQSLNMPKLAPDDNFYFNSGYKKEASSFIKVMYDIGSINFFADGQVRIVNFKYKPDKDYNITNKQITWSFFNPRVGVNVNLSDYISSYGSIGMTGREPTRNDMFAGYDDMDSSNISEIGDFTKVRPEKVIDTELGIKFNYKDFFVNANYFDMQFRNEIAAIGQLSYIGLPLRKNVPESYRRGIEVDYQYNFSDDFKIYGNVSRITAKIKKYGEFDNIAPILTPKWISNMSVEYCNFILNGRYVSKAYIDNANTTEMPSYFTMDFIGKLVIDRYALKLQVNNILDKKYYTGGQVCNDVPYYFIQAGINMFATFSVRF